MNTDKFDALADFAADQIGEMGRNLDGDIADLAADPDDELAAELPELAAVAADREAADRLVIDCMIAMSEALTNWLADRLQIELDG